MKKVHAIVVGTGGFARHHIRTMLDRKRRPTLVGFVKPADASRQATAALFAERGLPCPPFYGTAR